MRNIVAAVGIPQSQNKSPRSDFFLFLNFFARICSIPAQLVPPIPATLIAPILVSDNFLATEGDMPEPTSLTIIGISKSEESSLIRDKTLE